MTPYLFVYGTLQPGFAPAMIRSAVAALLRVDAGSTPGVLYELGPYPGARFNEAGVIHGTVYQLPADRETALLEELDAYEGLPDLYVRVAVPVTLADGRQLTCWAYQYNQDLTGRAAIPSGRYVPENRT